MKFCHISPIPHLKEFVEGRDCHLTLAHLVKEDQYKATGYSKFYQNEAMNAKGEPYLNIMDNSAFELYKAQLPMFPPDELVELAKQVKATHIVLPDHQCLPLKA